MGIELKGTFTEVEAPSLEGLFPGNGDMRKDRIMSFITSFLQEKGYCPSIREIGKGVGMKSPSLVYACMQELAGEGRIIFSRGMNEPRAYRVAGCTFIAESELEELRAQHHAAVGDDCGEDTP